MKPETLRIFCAVLSLLLLLPVIAACGSKEASPAADTVPEGGETDVATEAETTLHMPDLPENDWGGYEFNFLISSNDELGKVKNDIKADEQTGDTVNDARYERNLKTEEKYGIKLSTLECNAGTGGDGLKKFRASVAAGDASFDAAFMGGYDACVLAQEGMLYDLNSLPYIDLTNEWWDQKANADLTIKGRMFYTTGDISTADNDATYVIMFNKTLVKNYGLEDFYQDVYDGKWTLDVFKVAASSVHEDLNGNGEADVEDRFGILIWDDSMMGIVNSTGTKCCTVNPSGEIELTIYNDKVVNAIASFFEVAFDNQISLTYQRSKYSGWDGVLSLDMFSNDQALFFMRLLLDVANLRNMEADFGLLPYPKSDETVDAYYQTLGSWHSVFLCVPMTTSDPERTGIVLEAMAAESMYTVTPAYYDVALKGKYARDEESLDMLDIILESRCYDLGWFYAIGGYNEEVMNLLRNFKPDFTSMYEKRTKSAYKLIDKINTAFAEIDG
ncbi:MAG TPA: extracellular solute-binding protein [Clostridiales bacterium]|jgi:ABC-type glycerol-3-phosphate transport system substrate-binding protein|nr:extracellular solute-binding protein [Clostridiales bacterium]